MIVTHLKRKYYSVMRPQHTSALRLPLLYLLLNRRVFENRLAAAAAFSSSDTKAFLTACAGKAVIKPASKIVLGVMFVLYSVIRSTHHCAISKIVCHDACFV
jgi:hypothetical protein